MAEISESEALISYSTILIEFFEVAIHHIMFLRNLYPHSSFARKKLYGIPVQICIHPDVRKYVANVLKTTEDLLKKHELKKISVNILTEDSRTIERHFIHILRVCDSINEDLYYTRLESSLRSLYLKQSVFLGSLKPLPEICRYSIHIHTTEMGTSLVEDDTKPQDFPFVLVSKEDTELHLPEILPVSTIQMDNARMAMYTMFEDK